MCGRVIIKERIVANLSKMEVLSHQLCLVTKVKLKHCPGECHCNNYYRQYSNSLSPLVTDQLEETAALVDLVESGVNLLKTVDCVFRDLQTLSAVGACVNGEFRQCLDGCMG